MHLYVAVNPLLIYGTGVGVMLGHTGTDTFEANVTEVKV
jgi:hypothetical protein